MKPLWEKYRPGSWAEIVGHESVVAKLVQMGQRSGFAGKAYAIVGPSGQGKTTIARCIAKEVADEWAIWEVDAQDVSMDYLRWLEEQFGFGVVGTKNGKCWIINEMHGLSGKVISRLCTLLEKLPERCAIIFTTTDIGAERIDSIDAAPLFSRIVRIALPSGSIYAKKLTTALAVRAKEIAMAEELDGKPLAAYETLLNRCNNNMRTALTNIEQGCMLLE